MAFTLLSPEVVAAAKRSVLCWLATSDKNNQPNVTPKELFQIFDDRHLVIANIASPGSARNILSNPKVCVSFVDVFAQKGFKILGNARNIARTNSEFMNWATELDAMASPRFTIHSVFVVQASHVEIIVAPSYRLYPAETSELTQVESALHTYGVTRSHNGNV